MNAAMELHVALSLRLDATEAYRLAHAYRDEVLAEAGTPEAYDGELAMYRQLVRTLRVVVRDDTVDINEVRRLLHNHAADDAAARAESNGESRRTAGDTLADAARQADLLYAIRKNPNKRWKSGRALTTLHALGYTRARRHTAANDLARLADAGHLIRHEEKGVRWYGLARRGGGPR